MATEQKADQLNDSNLAVLTINEIFFSIQGETTYVGLPTIFIRLTACPLRCQYCDTEYAFYEGKKMPVDEILQSISNYKTLYVTVTGGEPLAQKTCHNLLTALCDKDYKVTLETSGAMDISDVDDRVIRIVDIKTPGSNEVAKNRFENIQHIRPKDEIKFVICDHNDYVWSKNILDKYKLTQRCEVLFSNSHTQLDPTDLADWILEDHLPVRIQLQMHKFLWGDSPGK